MAKTIHVLIIKSSTGGWTPHAASEDSEALKKVAPSIIKRVNEEYGFTRLFDEYHVFEVAVLGGGK